MFNKQKYQIFGFIMPAKTKEGFAVPIIKVSGEHNCYLQGIDQYSGLICRFDKVGGSVDFNILENPRPISCGEDPALVFVDEIGKTHVGTVSNLQKTLEKYATENLSKVDVVLQIVELTGTMIEKRAFRKKFRNRLFDDGEIEAANIFLKHSVLKAELWDVLKSKAVSRQAFDRMMAWRAAMKVEIDASNKVTIDISMLSPQDYGFENISSIQAIIQEELDETLKPEPEDRNYNLNDSSPDRAKEIFYNIMKSSRQEERISKLLRALINDQDLGTEILRKYENDRGGFAQQALKEIRHYYLDDGGPSIRKEALIRLVVDRIYRFCFPMNRGALL